MMEPPVKPPEPDTPRRPYCSAKRAERALRTRDAIRRAATTLFLRDGYGPTSMKAIAKLAGVSEKTMYLTYGTKASLLRDVIQVAVRGDEDPAALSERRDWRAIFVGPPDQAFARFAALNAALMARTADIIAVGEAAAASDPKLAAHRDRAHEAARADALALAAALKCRGLLAPSIDERDAADTIYAFAADEGLYLRLTRECGWSDERYAVLLGRTLQATLGSAASPWTGT